MAQRNYVPRGMGLGFLLCYGVHHVGARFAVPTRKSFGVNSALRAASEIDIVLTHGLGGGAESYLTYKIGNAPNGRAMFVVRPTYGVSLYNVDLHIRDAKVTTFFITGIEAFNGLTGRKCRIVLNELVGWPTIGKPVDNASFSALVLEVLNLKRRLGAKMVFLLHDYYCICPKYTLIDQSDKFCWPEKSALNCNECLKSQTWLEAVESIDLWRKDFARLLFECERIIAFSEDTKRRVGKCISGILIEVIPHELLVQLRPVTNCRTFPLTIGVVGCLRSEKGLYLVKAFAELLLKIRRNDVRIKVIGSIASDCTMPPNVDVLGSYNVGDLPTIIEREGVNVASFSSICAETFSFVTKELIAMGLPVACFDIGAQRDHVTAYLKGAAEIACLA